VIFAIIETEPAWEANDATLTKNTTIDNAIFIFCILPLKCKISLDQRTLSCYCSVRIDQTADPSLTMKIRFNSVLEQPGRSPTFLGGSGLFYW